MAKDYTGSHLAVGDKVYLPCTVTEVQEETVERPMHIAVETAYPATIGAGPNRFLLSGRQLVRGTVDAAKAAESRSEAAEVAAVKQPKGTYTNTQPRGASTARSAGAGR